MQIRYKHLIGAERWVGRLAAAALLMGMATCPKDMVLKVDPDFSVNLVRPAPTWPRLDRLRPGEIEAYQKYGRPDYFRVWFHPRGEIATSREAGPAIRKKILSELPRSWVYEQRKIEIQFPTAAKYVEVPLSDQLNVLCLRGDPHLRDVQTRSGMLRETWTYYDVGEIYIFLDGRLAEKQVLQGIGRPFRRM